ncbi:MAG: hypothetical protein AAFX02_11495 [Pseudomonadota bacterium]
MKRLLLSICVLASATPFASASPELAEKWGANATRLYTESVAHLSRIETDRTLIPPKDAYIDQTLRFAIQASRLGKWMDENTDTRDFGCIFRGMSEEADLQVQSLETAGSATDQVAALKRMIAMFDDAQTIAVAAIDVAQTGAASEGQIPRQCRANRATLDQYFTEQP